MSNRYGRVIAVDGQPIKKSEETPSTRGEVAADRPSQQADRAMLDRQHALEREQVVLYSIFHAHGTSRARQIEVSARLDEIEGELAALRENLRGKTQRVAKNERIVGRVDPLGGFGRNAFAVRNARRAAAQISKADQTKAESDLASLTTLTGTQDPIK